MNQQDNLTDKEKRAALAKELGFYPATLNREDIDRHRRLNRALSGSDHKHSPCPVCGKHTRYKQFPSRCDCNWNWPKDELPWVKAEKERRR